MLRDKIVELLQRWTQDAEDLQEWPVSEIDMAVAEDLEYRIRQLHRILVDDYIDHPRGD